MSWAKKGISKIIHPIKKRYEDWCFREDEKAEAEWNFILANRNNPDALARAGIIPPRERPPYHAKEYYESRGGRDDLFLEKVLYDKKKRRWL